MAIPTKYKDLIKTIDDNEEVDNLSEESDAEVDFQPTKQKNKKKKDFDTGFNFVSSIEEYNKDAWCDLAKYIKRKAKSKTDDKIKKAKTKLGKDDANEETFETSQMAKEDGDSDISLSEDDLKFDNIKTKDKKKCKSSNLKEAEETEDQFFEDVDITNDKSSFYEMNLSRPLMKAIGSMKFIHPTPIQAATIPLALLGRDICGCAATGTGKTAAYMLPTLERLLFRPVDNSVTRVLVLVPTRELGVQVYQVSKQLAQFSDIEIGLAVGGLDLKAQENILRKSPDIVIATPGRLIDHLQGTLSFNLNSIEVLILDEADRMLDEYFAEQMKQIIKQCCRTRQTMLFSATMTDEVRDLAMVSLQKPIRIFVDSNKEVAFNLRQEFIRIRNDKEGDRETILAALVCRTFRNHTIIFVQTKKQAHRLHILLGLCDVKIAELHGNLTQPQRLEALQKFKDEQVDVLVATDVAARGLDIPGVQTVINFVMPATLEHYIHRVGRTARAGRAGVSVSLAGEQERKMVKDIIKRAANPVKSRVIPNDIIEKYKTKLTNLEKQIQEILQEEYEERVLSKTEKQANRAQKLLNGSVDEKRPWFQTNKQRQMEKDRLKLDTDQSKTKKNSKDNKNSGFVKSKKKIKDSAEVRAQDELNKVAMLQARTAKRMKKPKKMSTIYESASSHKTGIKRKRSSFADELTDVSSKGSKKFRHEANTHNKNKAKNKNKTGKAPGKAFGKPKAKKSRF